MAQKGLGEGLAVVLVGSLARREASEQSDIDYFLVHISGAPSESWLEDVKSTVEAVGLRAPAAGGPFGIAISEAEFLKRIGGSEEENNELTRRMLFLLESEWLFGERMYAELFRSMIERYIWDGITQHQLARFFLNDVIRFYRTMCVDFAYKTSSVGKSWGDRNLKLLFARKLMYFSGVFAAAETVESACEYKRMELLRLLRLCPIDRFIDVCGDEVKRVLMSYDRYLGWMADESRRRILRDTVEDRGQHTPEFREMKNAAHHFSWDLESLLHRRYAPTHPIYQALLF